MKKISLVALTNKRNGSFIQKETKKWEKYFTIDVKTYEPKLLETLLRNKIDLLILDESAEQFFKLEYYKKFQNNNNRFKYIILKKSREASDIQLYKRLCDNIIYTNEKKLASWEMMSLLRRFWNTNSKPTTIIFRSIVADFIENTILVEGKEINMTVKEIKVLRILLLNRTEYVSKDEIYKKVWKFDDKDTTRVLDQIIFKLKKKIGKDYFKVSRTSGVKIT